MNLDFQGLMVLALVATGAVWAADSMVWAPRRQRRAEAAMGGSGDEKEQQKLAKEPLVVEWSRSFFPIILVVLVLRSFIVEPFRIPSGSMMPTLLAGDFILVNKFSYGLRLPIFGTKIYSIGEPRRGDIVVFRYPVDPSVDYIKRVVGLPGDRVRYIDKTLYINDKLMPQEAVGTYTGVGVGRDMSGAAVHREQLGQVNHEILLESFRRLKEGEFVVPAGHYFVMGDNRDNSNDSRYWGTVPEANLVGKAFFIWMSWDKESRSLNWDRIGSHVK